MNKRAFLPRLTILLVLITFPLFAQSFIPLNVDFAVFRGKDNQPYVEIYLTFLQDRLEFKTVEEGLHADFQVEVVVSDGNTEIDSREQTFVNTVAGEDDIEQGNYLHSVFPFLLAEGEYDFSVSVSDLNSGVKGNFTIENVQVNAFDDLLAISEIQLASAISRSEEQGDLVKNGLKIVPNPSGVFSILAPMVYYYAEIYQLEYDPQATGNYSVAVKVLGRNGEVVRQLSNYTRAKPGSSAVVVGGQNLVTLPNGAYFLEMTVTDENTGFVAQNRKRFAMFKPQKPDSVDQLKQSDVLASILAQKPEEELDLEFEQVIYLATSAEKSIYSELDKEGKARFLYEFWKRRDTTPETPVNEYRNAYFQLLTLVNERFSTQFKDGWKSDRGRIVLTYGLPTEVERFPSSMGNKPYERWTYNELEGGSVFIFGDLQGFGDYDLLHSTYSRELSQSDWERRILKQDRNNQVLQTDN